MNKTKHWYDYLWIVTPIYFALGFFNILFAWIGMIFFCLPLLIAIFGGSKLYCNRYCDRGQFFTLLGKKLKLSRNHPTPRWIGSKWFRYGFLIFFFAMFFQMLWVTYLVGSGANSVSARRQAVLDLPGPLGLGLSRHRLCPLGGPIRLRLLRYDADLHPHWSHCHGPIPAPLLVRLLPHGHHDPMDLQAAGRKNTAPRLLRQLRVLFQGGLRPWLSCGNRPRPWRPSWGSWPMKTGC